MSSLQAKIKNDLKEAMIASDNTRKNLLRVVIGEFNRLGKDINDDLAVKEIKKMYNNAKELGNDSEAKILEAYIPQELSENQLRDIITDVINSKNVTDTKGIGIIMGELRSEYPNQYDGKLAAKIVKQVLNLK